MASESKNISPVGWYVGSYLLRFVESGDAHQDAVDRRCLVWENTVRVKAGSRAEAYDKTVSLASECTRPYKGGKEAADVRWVLEGVTDILPVYEEIGDGAEIFWSEYRQSLRKLRGRVRSRDSFEPS